MSELTFGMRITYEGQAANAGLEATRGKVEQLASSFDKHNGAAKQASGHLNAVEASASKLNTVLYGLAAKVAGVFLGWKAAEFIKDTVLLAARLETLDVVLGTVGNNAGYTRAEMAGFTKEVASMGITMLESRQTVISMAQAQMDLTNAGKLARVAQDAAVIGNINSSEALGRMIYGIKSGQVEVLRTIGINVNFEASYKRLADELHKKTDALTEAEKAQARTNAVTEAGERIAGTYEAAMGTAGKQLNSLSRYHENLRVVMGGTFTEALAAAVGAYTDELKDLNAEAQELKVQGDLKEWGRATGLMLATVGDSARMLVNTLMVAQLSLRQLMVMQQAVTIGSGVSFAEAGASLKKLRAEQSEHIGGMFDNLKLYNAVSAMFDNIDAKAKASADKRLATETDYISKAQAVAAAYSGTKYQVPALLALADSYGGDIAAAHGSRKTSADSGVNTPVKPKRAADPNAAAVARIQMDAFKAQMDAMGVAAEQVKVYELAMSGADDKQIAAAQSSAYLKIELDAQAKAAKEAGKAQDEANKQLQRSALEAQAIIFDIDPIARAGAEWEKLIALKEKGLLTDEQIGKSYAKTFGDIAKAGDDSFKSLENAVRGWGNEFTNQMTQMVRTSKMDFASLADSIINDLIRIQIQKNITDPLLKVGTNLLGSIVGGMFGGSNAAGPVNARGTPMTYAADGGAFSGPGISAYSGSVVDKPTLFPFARGVGLMGEAGEEGIFPLTRINGKLGIQAQGGGGSGVTVNIINAPAGTQVQQRSDGNGGMTLDVIIEQIEGGIARNVSRGTGSLNGALTQTFGLNRTAGAMR